MPGTKLFVILLLVGAVCAAPASKENDDDDQIHITKEFYEKDFVCYEGEHEIVNILLPMNSLNVYEDDDVNIETFDDNKFLVFFVEADIDANGQREDKGLYALHNGVATKLLEHGRDAAANNGLSNDVFFAAQDGIYIYDYINNKAVKYGSVSDDIIAIATENATEFIYYLNKDHELYKVSEEGHKADKIDDVVGAQEIVLDYENNLYYYTEDKEVYVKTESGVTKVEGLPENPKNVKLIRPPFLMEDSVLFLSNNEYYVIYSNGTSETTEFSIAPKARPSAYSMDATVIQYFGFQKKIYRFNIFKMTTVVLEELSKFFEENETTLQKAAPKKFSKKQKH